MSQLRVPSFIVVTGASRGIGRAIAIQLANEVDSKSSIYLTARSIDGLKETADMIKQNIHDDVEVKCIDADLSNEEGMQYLTESLFNDVGNLTRFPNIIIIHNAASVEILEIKARDLDDVHLIQKYCLFNITAPIVLTSAILRHFKNVDARRTIVNLTSLAATVPFRTSLLYGMSKAGREMFFRVMALQEPDVKILSYDPGFVDTDMFTSFKNCTDDGVCSFSTGISKDPIFLTPDQTAQILVKVILENKYKSGETVRCYDVMNIDVDAHLQRITKSLDK